MAAAITLQPVTLASTLSDRHGQLVFVDGELAALVVRLDDEAHEEDVGSWFLEAGFGGLESAPPRVFATVEAAQAWVAAELDGPRRA